MLRGAGRDVAGQLLAMGQRAAVLDRRAPQREFVERDGHITGGKRLADVRSRPVGRAGHAVGDELVKRGAELRGVVRIGLRIDVIGWIDGKKRKACRGRGVDISGRFQMVGVAAEAGVVAAFKHAEGGFVHDLLRRAPRTVHFADRLLRQNQHELAVTARRNMARRSQPQAIAQADRRPRPGQDRPQVRDLPAQRRHGRFVRIADQSARAVDFNGRSRKAFDVVRRVRNRNDLTPVSVTRRGQQPTGRRADAGWINFQFDELARQQLRESRLHGGIKQGGFAASRAKIVADAFGHRVLHS